MIFAPHSKRRGCSLASALVSDVIRDQPLRPSRGLRYKSIRRVNHISLSHDVGRRSALSVTPNAPQALKEKESETEEEEPQMN